MLVGALSDTHSRLDTARQAIELLRRRGAKYLFHCGDIGNPQLLDLFTGAPAAIVFGNCDLEHDHLHHTATALGINYFGPAGRLTLDEKVICFLHGDDHRRMQQILLQQDCDLLLHGHTHIRRVDDVGRIRIVNPGALHRAHTKTVALIDTATREVEFLEVE